MSEDLYLSEPIVFSVLFCFLILSLSLVNQADLSLQNKFLFTKMAWQKVEILEGSEEGLKRSVS